MAEAGGVVALDQDAYLWLEDVGGDKQLAWVRERNAETAKELESSSSFKKLEEQILEVLDSKDTIPLVTRRGGLLYNYWQDAKNPRGLWRRTTLEEFRKPKPTWETVLDVDALGAAEKEKWVYKGVECLYPEPKRCLISLSRGGADAVVIREFDMEKKAFVPEGFQIPEAKGNLAWIDLDTVYVRTDFGPGSMTTSGYPRIVKRWKRGQPLADATVVYEGEVSDVGAYGYRDLAPGFERDFIVRYITIFTKETFLLAADGSKKKIEVPEDADFSIHREWMIVNPKKAWEVGGKTIPAGALVATRFDAFMEGKRDFQMLFEPTPTRSLADTSWTKGHLILNVLDDVKNRLEDFTPPEGTTSTEWKRAQFAGAPALGTVSVWGVDSDQSDEIFMQVTDYLTPTTLSYGTVGQVPEKLKSTPAFFDASKHEVSQHFATSKDGTRVPYFQVSKKGMKLDGSNPTVLTGYGGFEVPQLPKYSGTVGRSWLSQGGVYVVANIRGGGEYGPAWHQAALKANRPKSFEDFAAVATDLVARKVTTAKRLGIVGGSNGGLLVGNMVTRYPQLFGAVVCQVPLLDMKRYSHLLAGASWMGEYGDPDKP
ncbi:MAG TPA: prolyl oligopeptidase family serine peptidase, partial [Gaiellaceae bacterium]|nr:prolyl oligopeptidase family serine peptidase [Gaiellaceae bacterium]